MIHERLVAKRGTLRRAVIDRKLLLTSLLDPKSVQKCRGLQNVFQINWLHIWSRNSDIVRRCRRSGDGSVWNLYNDDCVVWFHNFFNK